MLEPVLSQAPFDQKNDEELIEADKQELISIYNSFSKMVGWVRSKCDSCGETRNDCFVDLRTLGSKCRVCRTFEIFKERHQRDPY